MKPKFPKMGKPPYTAKKIGHAVDTAVSRGGIIGAASRIEPRKLHVSVKARTARKFKEAF